MTTEMAFGLVIGIVIGFLVGIATWAFIISRDKDIVHIKADEIIVKRPQENMILVQVTPSIARRLVMNDGKMEPQNASEARAMHPELALKRRELEEYE